VSCETVAIKQGRHHGSRELYLLLGAVIWQRLQKTQTLYVSSRAYTSAKVLKLPLVMIYKRTTNPRVTSAFAAETVFIISNIVAF
jgi:hypothetical protein